MCEPRWRDLGGARRPGVDPDGNRGDERMAGEGRAVTAAAGVMPAAEIRELPAVRSGDEQLAGVRIRERRPGAVKRVGMVEDGGVAARLPPVAGRLEAELLALAARDRLTVLEAQRRLDGRLSVDARRQLRRIEAGPRKDVDLAGAVGGGDDDVAAQAGERLLHLRHLPDVRLTVVAVKDHRVAIEERA